MKDFRSMAFVIFADIAFQLCNGLAAGYYFVTLKEQEAKHVECDHAESHRFKEKGIEVPVLDNGNDGESPSDDQNSIEILVPKEGGKFIIGGETVQKSELDTALKNMKNTSCTVSVDKTAPSGDTLYLFDVLNRHNLKVKIVYLGDK